MAKISPAQFVREVRQEASRVTWPTRKETIISSVMVCVMAVIASLFFLAVDSVISQIVKYVLSLGE